MAKILVPVLVNDLKFNNGVFSHIEDEFYFNCLHFARDRKIPFVYFANNSGAEIKLNEYVKYAVKPHLIGDEFKYLYLDADEFTRYKDELSGVFKPEHNHYEIIGINKPTWRIYEYNYDLYVMEERVNMVVFVGGNAGLMYAT